MNSSGALWKITKYSLGISVCIYQFSGSDCRLKIQNLESKGLIQKSKSPWSYAPFYVNKNSEIEWGTSLFVINYKPLNKALKWIRYLIPNKKDLLQKLYSTFIFSKFDMKSRFWQVQIHPKDHYKIAFTIPFGPFEWNFMPFGLKKYSLGISKDYEWYF